MTCPLAPLMWQPCTLPALIQPFLFTYSMYKHECIVHIHVCMQAVPTHLPLNLWSLLLLFALAVVIICVYVLSPLDWHHSVHPWPSSSFWLSLVLQSELICTCLGVHADWSGPPYKGCSSFFVIELTCSDCTFLDASGLWHGCFKLDLPHPLALWLLVLVVLLVDSQVHLFPGGEPINWSCSVW